MPGGRTCAECGAALTPTGRFCPECGAPVQVAEVSRRVVTLLFTDVAGSTALGERLDPESLRQVMERYFQVVREAIDYHGGTVEKFVGDAVLAVFGWPQVREDDALRAVRAAADLTAAVAALSDELEASIGERLEVRTGVNTGEVVTGEARAGGSFATGDAVNTAARLEQAAGPGQILLGAVTRALVRDEVEVTVLDSLEAPGKSQPVPAYQLLSVRDPLQRVERPYDSPLQGRDREQRVLQDAFRRAVSGRAQLVTVIGGAGLGKTRLVAEFSVEAALTADVVEGRCLPYGQGITYLPVAQALRQSLGLSGDESEEVARHALATALGPVDEAHQVVKLLLPVVSGYGDAGSAGDTAWAIRRLLEALAARRPLVMTLDDLQWAEPTLLELIERLHHEVFDLPLLLVCQARPELLDLRPGWGGGSADSIVFGLEPLTTDEVAASLGHLLDGEAPDEVVAAVAQWSGGNPLFIEEIATHLRETGLLVHDRTWLLTRPLTPADAPPSVAALLAARLARLPEAERRLLQRVAVIGQEFTAGDAAVLGADDPHLLASLTRDDLLRRVRSSGGDHRQSEHWEFRHVLVRDAAYDALPKAERAELHQQFAAAVAAGSSPDRAAFLAHHLEQAARHRYDLAPHEPTTTAVVNRAVDALGEAASEASLRDDPAAVRAMLARALNLPAADDERIRALLVRLFNVELAGHRADNARRVVRLLADLTEDDELDRATLRCVDLMSRLEQGDEIDPDELRAAGEHAEHLARAADDPLRLQTALHALVDAANMLGRWREVGRLVDELRALGGANQAQMAFFTQIPVGFYGDRPYADGPAALDGLAGPAPTPRQQVSLETVESVALAAAGSPLAAAGLAAAEEAWAQVPGAMHGWILVAHGLYLAGDLEQAIALHDRSLGAMRATDDRATVATYLLFNALWKLELDLHDPAVESIVDEAEAMTSRFDLLNHVLLASSRSLLASRDGDHVGAMTLAHEAIRRVDELQMPFEQAQARRYAAGVADAAGDTDAARMWREQASERYAAKGATRLETLSRV